MGKRRGIFAAARPGIERRNAEMLSRYKAGENLASIGAMPTTAQRFPPARAGAGN
jgi:hypothetical protein